MKRYVWALLTWSLYVYDGAWHEEPVLTVRTKPACEAMGVLTLGKHGITDYVCLPDKPNKEPQT